MPKGGRRVGPALVALAILATIAPNAASARNAGAVANTLTATCTAALSVQPVSEKLGTGGSFSATLRAPCFGHGFAYNFIEIAVTRSGLGGAFKGISFVDCDHVPVCSMDYTFSGGPDHFEVDAFVWWDSTAGPWEFATPGVVVSSAPFCYGVDTGEWPVTPLGPASRTVGCNLLADLVL